MKAARALGIRNRMALCFPPAQMAVSHVAPEVLAEALGADVVTYGSPSAVKAWVSLAGLKVANAKVGGGGACDVRRAGQWPVASVCGGGALWLFR